MTTQLTTPVVDTVVGVTVESWQMKLRYNDNFTVDPTSSQFEIIVADRRADGSVKQQRNLLLTVSELTNGQKTTLRNFDNSVTAFARAAGLIPPGVDTANL